MKNECQFLISTLSDYCHEIKTTRPSYSLDLDSVLNISTEQNLSGIVYTQIKQWLKSEPACQKFIAAFIGDVFLSVNRADILKEIATRFREAGIDFICMKGSVFRDYYPVPELRSMGDLDIIIHPKDREKADAIMINDMHFEKFVDNHAVWTYLLGQIEIEIHDHMFYEYLANRVDYREYFDHIWEHVHHEAVFGIEAENLYVPDENYHFLYLMTHTAKHIINNGNGFRAYLDMVMISQNCSDLLDWKWIEAELSRLQLLDFTKVCFALCERWFHVDMSIQSARLEEEFFVEVTAKTFNDGIFGLDNEQNHAAHTAKEIKRSENPYAITAIRLTFQKLFPSYKDMQLIPWYSFVDGRPWLLPFAWVYRWFYCLTHKMKSGADLLAEPFLKRKAIEEREALIKKWGL